MSVARPSVQLDDLLAPEGQAFVHNAYRLLLGRAVDPSGERYYTDLLREGWSKWHVLNLLYRCDECRQHGVNVPGLMAELTRYTRAQRRTLGGWYRRSVLGVESDLPPDRRLRAFQQRLLGDTPVAQELPAQSTQTWRAVADLTPDSNQLAPAWAGHTFGAAASLGCFCHAAAVLRRLDMRAGSGPFDWLFMSPAAVAHVLTDGFQRFMDPAEHELVADKDKLHLDANVCEHRYYRKQFGVRFMFNHHNPTQDPDRAHFTRAVARFQGQLRAAVPGHRPSGAPLLLLLMSYEPVTPAQIDTLLAALGAVAGADTGAGAGGAGWCVLAVRLLVVGESAIRLSGMYEVLHESPHHVAVELCVRAQCNGLSFPHDSDNQALSQLLNTFKVQRHPRRAVHQPEHSVPG